MFIKAGVRADIISVNDYFLYRWWISTDRSQIPFFTRLVGTKLFPQFTIIRRKEIFLLLVHHICKYLGWNDTKILSLFLACISGSAVMVSQWLVTKLTKPKTLPWKPIQLMVFTFWLTWHGMPKGSNVSMNCLLLLLLSLPTSMDCSSKWDINFHFKIGHPHFYALRSISNSSSKFFITVISLQNMLSYRSFLYNGIWICTQCAPKYHVWIISNFIMYTKLGFSLN